MSLNRSTQITVDPNQEQIELQNKASIELERHLLTGKCEVYFGWYGTYINFPVNYSPSEFLERILKAYGAEYKVFDEYQENDTIFSSCLYIRMRPAELLHILNVMKERRNITAEDNIGFRKPVKHSKEEYFQNDLINHRVHYKVTYFDELNKSEQTSLCNETAVLATKLLKMVCKVRNVGNYTYIDFPLNTDEDYLHQIALMLRQITKPFRPFYSEDKDVQIYYTNHRTIGCVLLGPSIGMDLTLDKLQECLKANVETNQSESMQMDWAPSEGYHFTALLDRSENKRPVYKSGETRIIDSFPQTEKLLAYNLKVERLVANYDTSDFGSFVLASALKNNKFAQATKLLLPQSRLHNDSLIAFSIALISGHCPENFTIDLSNNFIGDKSVQILARALESEFCPDYLTIILDRNKIEAQGAIALAQVLKSNKCPFGLNITLNDNSIGSDGFNALLEAMKTDNFAINNTQITMQWGWGQLGDKTQRMYEAALAQINKRREQIKSAAFACLCLYNSKKDKDSPFFGLPLEIIRLISFFAFPFKDADKQAQTFARNIHNSMTVDLNLRFGFFHHVSVRQPKGGVVIESDIGFSTCDEKLPEILKEQKPMDPTPSQAEPVDDENDTPCLIM